MSRAKITQDILLSLNAALSSLGEFKEALERGGFVGGVNLTSLGTTNLANPDPSQDPSKDLSNLTQPPYPPSHQFVPIRPISAEGREVFEHWKKIMGKSRSVFDRKRQRAVSIQLKGRTVDELKRAVDGCKLDPFSMGQNDRAQVYNDFCLIFRDAAHVEKFIAIADAGPGVRLPSAPDPAKLRADAAAERRKQETRRLLDRQAETGNQISPQEAKQRLADLIARVGK